MMPGRVTPFRQIYKTYKIVFMKKLLISNPLKCAVAILMSLFIFSACDRSSSPEGRMSMKMEDLQKEMINKLEKQNQAILDSLGNIRRELEEIKQKQK